MTEVNIKNRIKGLDGLRALSVIAVFAHHTGFLPVHGGFIGVDLFFVLSGYLITQILMREHERTGSIDILGFCFKRLVRLYPALIVFTASVAVYILVASPPGVSGFWETVPALLYFMNWVRAFWLYDAPLTAHTWSLGIETQFYIVWPFLLLLAIRTNKPSVMVLMLLVISIAWKLYLSSQGASAARIYSGFDTHSDGVLIGCILAISPACLKIRFGQLAWPFAVGYLVFCLFSDAGASFASSAIGYTVSSVASAAVICKVLSSQNSLAVKILNAAPLDYLGRISYGFYLWHYAVIKVILYSGYDVFGAFFGGLSYPKTSMVAACFVGSLVPTLLSWYLVERPAMKFGSGHST